MLAHPRWAVFWLFAIGELVGDKPCAILATARDFDLGGGFQHSHSKKTRLVTHVVTRCL